MRLDKYLKVSRLIRRRTVANDACDGGRVKANGKSAKASYEVKVGDILDISMGTKKVSAEVSAIVEQVGKADASSLYRIIDGSEIE